MRGTVIQVTNGGRGFVIEACNDRYVVTAAHCLPGYPEPFGAAGGNASERTYDNLLGRLGASLDVTAECVFIDLIADLAVFGKPEVQELFDQAEAYQELTDSAVAFPLGRLRFRRPPIRLSSGTTMTGPPKATSKAMMLSLDGEWFECRVSSSGRSLLIEDAAQPIQSGMSGSPIILPDGSAVGVVCVGKGGEGFQIPNPLLSASLPKWLMRDDY